jgi:hypothetical protein
MGGLRYEKKCSGIFYDDLYRHRGFKPYDFMKQHLINTPPGSVGCLSFDFISVSLRQTDRQSQ